MRILTKLLKWKFCKTSSRLHSSTFQEPLRILFYGSDEFSLTSLKALNENRFVDRPCVKSLEVVATEGAKNLVKDYARKHELLIHTWPYTVPHDAYDVGVVVSFGHLIKENMIKACKYGMINVHGSLLPKWRGAAPIIYSILCGDKETGITVMQIAPKRFDVGNIILQEAIEISPKVTRKELSSLMADLGGKLLLKALWNLPECLKNSVPQPTEGVSLAPKIKPELGELFWNKTCLELDCQYRALSDVIPLYANWKGKFIKFLDKVHPDEVELANLNSLISDVTPEPGFCYFHKKRKYLFIRCANGWVAFRQFVLNNKRISAQDFYNGYITKEKIHKFEIT